jgi:CDGSH-type Zn-finger protein
MAEDPTPPPAPSINVVAHGPLVLTGGVPVVRRRIVESEHGEPLTYETTEDLGTKDRVQLCRCGQSATKPFCDASHRRVGFEADDTAGGTYDDRSKVLGGTGLTVRDDRSVCVHAGFCGSRVTNVWKSVADTEESTVRAQVIAMIEHCPSGALTFRLDPDGDDVEPLLAQAVTVLDDGPLWVTGGIRVAAGSVPFETRNRVTLCRCGGSGNKPLCDGSHKERGFRDSGSAAS